MDQLIQILAPLISAYAGDYGPAVQIVAFIGTFRLFFKPIMAAVASAVKESPSLNDDEVLGKVTGHSIYKGFIFLLDLIGSIKVNPKK